MNSQVTRFSTRLAMILMPFLLLFSWIEYKARHLPNSYAVKKEELAPLQDSLEILVLGSSHALKGIMPSAFSCTGFNLSNSSQTLVHDSWLCRHYLGHLPELKAVIFDISYISYFFDLKDSPESWRNYFYYHYFNMKDPSLDMLSPAAFFYSSLYTKGMINDIVFSRLDPGKEFGDIREDGWEMTDPPEDAEIISDSAGLQRVRLHESLRKQSNSKEILQHFREALSELNRRNIRIFFIATPVFKTYYEHLNPELEKENQRITENLCKEYNAVYRDFSRDPRFEKKDFSDNDHLNRYGAIKFSRILEEEVLSGFCRR